MKKSVNGVDTLYTLNGKKITHIRKGTNGASGTDAVQMHFFYDAQGRPMMVRYNGTDYAYLHNLQGDIVSIVDMSGATVVEYGYDAWGKPISTEGSMAGTLGYDNPFRYRGYVWDEETGLYYLRSRYYDPSWGRFVNADTLLGKTGDLLSNNGFAYCSNNSVNTIDLTGFEGVDIYTQQELYKEYGAGGHGYARINLSNGVVIDGTISQTPEFYHFDFFPARDSLEKTMPLLKKAAGGEYNWKPIVIIFEVDYHPEEKGGKISMLAVVLPYPHVMVDNKAVLKPRHGQDMPKGTPHLCISVLNSSTSLDFGHKSAGKYNDLLISTYANAFAAAVQGNAAWIATWKSKWVRK